MIGAIISEWRGGVTFIDPFLREPWPVPAWVIGTAELIARVWGWVARGKR